MSNPSEKPTTLKAENIQERIERAIASDVPVIYANSFINTSSNADVMLIFERNGKPAAILNMGLTLTKTLAVKLAQMISDMEAATGRDIMTTDYIEGAAMKSKVKN